MSTHGTIDLVDLNLKNEIEQINKEIDHLIVEKRAFIEFAENIESMNTNPGTGSKTTDYVSGNNECSALTDRIKQAYSKSILDISHYNEIYAEPVEKNMIHELGYDLYLAVEESTSLQHYLKNSLIRAATGAADRRKNFKSLVEKEKKYICDFEHSAREIYEELTNVEMDCPSRNDDAENQENDEILKRLLIQCEQLAIDRQYKIQSRSKVASEFYTGDFEEYLYSELETMYPVLNLLSQFMRIIKHNIESWPIKKKSL